MKPKEPLLSIIIPTKNEEKNITRCLRSIKKQTYKGHIEIILVDNHSEDRTVAIATPYVSEVIIAGPERSAQRNVGAQRARGKWLLFVDADMELSPDVLEECLTLTQERVIEPIIAITEKGVGHTFWGKALALERNCYVYTFWLQAARFFPRHYFLKYGGYDETLVAGEDWDITQRLRDVGLPMLMTKQSYIIHHEPKLSFIQLMRKELYYTQHIDNYAVRHPLPFSYQGSLLYRTFVWSRSWHTLIQHPILTSAFLAYKLFIWFFWQFYKRRSPLLGKHL